MCRKCERWNLTPLEERWEAIEECERWYRDSRRRVATDNIGLSRLPDGTDLVRIGAPQRPEMAAWRYGDTFGRRRRRNWAATGGAALLGGGLYVGSTLAVLGSASVVFELGTFYLVHRLITRPLVHIRLPDGTGRWLR